MNNKSINKLMSVAKERSPELLISAGVVGMVTSTVLAVKATPKAIQLMEDKKAELGVTYLTKKEMVETAWKPYVPAIGVGLAGAACIIMGTSQNLKRNAALATVYAVTENTLKEYQRKTVEIVGQEKADEIKREVAKGRMSDRPVITDDGDSEYIIHTGQGNTLVFDSFSGRYFRSSKNAIDRAVNSINKSLINEHYMSVNDFYNELGVPTIYAGSIIGWSSDVEFMDVSYETDVDNNGNPYIVLTHYNRPRPLNNRYSSY